MRQLKDVRGLRFPDEMVVRMFFKEGLHQTTGRVLEFGCGNGNNLALFAAFGWDVTGVDMHVASLDDARWNFTDSTKATFVEADLSSGVPALEGSFDVVLLPNINYYIPRRSFLDLLYWISQRLVAEGVFFIRARTLDDWRYGRGVKVEKNGFMLECGETGEAGLLNVFYSRDELASLVNTSLNGLTGMRTLHVGFDNPANDTIVSNDDIVIWGRRRLA